MSRLVTVRGESVAFDDSPERKVHEAVSVKLASALGLQVPINARESNNGTARVLSTVVKIPRRIDEVAKALEEEGFDHQSGKVVVDGFPNHRITIKSNKGSSSVMTITNG